MRAVGADLAALAEPVHPVPHPVEKVRAADLRQAQLQVDLRRVAKAAAALVRAGLAELLVDAVAPAAGDVVAGEWISAPSLNSSPRSSSQSSRPATRLS